jgi:hypothetical protein
MKRPPVVREKVYSLYWYLASERQRIFEQRLAGKVGPWTSDPILQQYKFCNVFRAADRVSQYLIRHVIYSNEPCTPDDKLFQIVAFRMFSKEATWDALRKYLGRSPIVSDLADNTLTHALEYAKTELGGLYTGAFILCANNAYGQPAKHLNHVELFRHMFLTDNLGKTLLAAPSLREIYELLHAYPLMGDFMSYQIAIDLNYSDLINFDEDDFVKAGPGALRGITKAFEDQGDYTAEELIMWMVKRQTEEFTRYSLPFHGLFGRPLHAIDCQGLFCELDKYCRIALPELKSARKRMKAAFHPKPPLELYFPPKWKLDMKEGHPAMMNI